MNNEFTVKFVQDTVTKKWVWKLIDDTGSVVAKASLQYDSEDLAKEAFADFQNDAANAPLVDATNEPVDTAPVNVESPTIEPEAPAAEPTPETGDVTADGTEPVAPAEDTTGTVNSPEATDETAGTVENAPVEDAGTAELQA